MSKEQIKIKVTDIYSGAVSINELLAEMVAQSLQNQSGKVWTRTQSGDILKAPIVKFQSVLSVTGGTHDTPN
ncbi:MAG TPA: hypothetical protein DEB10_10645 [Ruminococcaceae bacterium]|nr:hypothetical protein [Oscillospiraceae bacterium]